MNVTRYVERKGITVEITRDAGYQVDEQKWEHHAYTLTVKRIDRASGDTFTMDGIAWRQGLGITETPDDRPDAVFDSLISDAYAWEDARSFEDFCRDFGYDTDSRKAEAIYTACGDMRKRLAVFVGGESQFHALRNLDRL